MYCTAVTDLNIQCLNQNAQCECRVKCKFKIYIVQCKCRAKCEDGTDWPSPGAQITASGHHRTLYTRHHRTRQCTIYTRQHPHYRCSSIIHKTPSHKGCTIYYTQDNIVQRVFYLLYTRHHHTRGVLSMLHKITATKTHTTDQTLWNTITLTRTLTILFQCSFMCCRSYVL